MSDDDFLKSDEHRQADKTEAKERPYFARFNGGRWYLGQIEIGWNIADRCVAEIGPSAEDGATAKLLARAVNCHDDLVAALPDPDKLEILAAWFDKHGADHGPEDREVQADLRLCASNARAAKAAAHDTD